MKKQKKNKSPQAFVAGGHVCVVDDEKPVKKKKKKKSRHTLFESLLIMITMITALAYMDCDYELGVLKQPILTIFGAAAVADIIKAAKIGKKAGVDFVKYIIVAILYIVGFVLSAAAGSIPIMTLAAYTSYSLTLVVGRVCSLIKKHKKRNVFINIILFFMILFLFLLPLSYYQLDDDSKRALPIILLLMFMFQSLIRIIGISLSQIRFDILKRIVEKSMAVEILSGLALLIVSFSFVFRAMEESIETFFDGVWYCFAIVTTIGFGDYTAESLIGRLLSMILGVYGIIVVSLITSIIINFYTETKDMITDDDDDSDDSEPQETSALTEQTEQADVQTEPEPVED